METSQESVEVEAEEITQENCSLEEEEMEQSSSSEITNKQKISERTMEKITRTGIAFLLQQMRSEEKANKEEFNQKSSTKEALSSENVKESVKMAIVKTPPKEPVKVTYAFDSLKTAPLHKVTECFYQGTTPDFGFAPKIKENNYVRSCKWSPNGNCLISESMDRRIRIFKYDLDAEKLIFHGKICSGGLIYELQWHPKEELFASTSKDQPIHVWDENGTLRISFRGINNVDELSSAFSLAFSLDGQTIYGGYRKKIKLFNIERPGRQIKEIKTYSKEMIVGQKSIISSIAMCPSMAGCYAVGCYAGSIGLYSDQTGSCDCFFGTESLGVTHLQYSSDGNLLYVGYRKNDLIECFDLRFPGQILSRFHRPVTTNQRIYFQRDSENRFLFSGSTTGDILVYDMKFDQLITSSIRVELEAIQPKWKIPVSRATVAGLSLHPTRPVVAITTGQRVFPSPLTSDNDSDDGDEEMMSIVGKKNYTSVAASSELDNSVQLWKFG